MTVREANDIVQKYYRTSNPDNEQDFLFTEALNFLIEETKLPNYMMALGGWYYEKRHFALAAKYYEMAAEYEVTGAYACLGYIWYYGRTGETDYEKAFKYYSLAANDGDLESAYKVADMYKNGYFVEKDYEKYKAIIKKLYEKVKDATNLYAPLPQIFIRLARIRTEEGNPEEAISLYECAKSFLAQRLRINPFFGDLNNMKWLIEELYRLTEFDRTAFDFYDLYYLLTAPNKITFRYENKTYHLESVMEDGECVICFEDKWYRTVDDFFGNAVIGSKRLTGIYDDLYLFEVI